MNVANFSETAIEKVRASFEKHKEKKLPEKPISKLTNSKNTYNSKANKKDIFIVHSHNEKLKEKVARTIEKLNLNPVILHEQSNEVQPVIKKFERHSILDIALIL